MHIEQILLEDENNQFYSYDCMYLIPYYPKDTISTAYKYGLVDNKKDNYGYFMGLKNTSNNDYLIASNYFSDLLIKKLDKYSNNKLAITNVPSSNPTKINSGLACFVSNIAEKFKIQDKSKIITRVSKIDKCTENSHSRNLSIQYDSVSIKRHIVNYDTIIILDDILTSGASSGGSRKRLEHYYNNINKDVKIINICLGKTTHL